MRKQTQWSLSSLPILSTNAGQASKLEETKMNEKMEKHNSPENCGKLVGPKDLEVSDREDKTRQDVY